MARYARQIPNAGEAAWDSKVNDNFQNVFDRPLPLVKHAGDLTSLQTAFPANQYDQALAICQYSSTAGDGLIFAISDGTAWRAFSGWQLSHRRLITENPASPLTVDNSHDFVLKSNSTALTSNLPAIAGSNKGRVIWFKNKAGTANNLTVSPNGANTIDGAASLVLTPGQAARLVSDGAGDWLVM
jgi:hypothetical protein